MTSFYTPTPFSHPVPLSPEDLCGLNTVFTQSCFIVHILTWQIYAFFTGSPWKCPQICSCSIPKHTACHHEADRRAAILLAATDAGSTHRIIFRYVELHVILLHHRITALTISLPLVHLSSCPLNMHLSSDGPAMQ